jgi:RNA polymerase sigma factor (sigma-70 family)
VLYWEGSVSPRVSVRLLATQPDERLRDLAGRGYERAFEAIVLRYRRPLLTYCARLGLPDGRAEDVVQQAFMKAWVALRAGTEVRELRPWLYRIVHNAAVNTLRSAPERKLTFVDLDALEGAVTESVLEQRLAAREALTDVASLPPMQREAILMSAVDGRSHDEVAGALGITSGAVRGLLYRARATLRGAAAALVPPPLVMWASRSGGVVSPAAISLGRLSGSSTGELGSMLVKGAVLAAGAVVAAGAVLVPHHTRPHRASDNDRAMVAAVSPGATDTGGLVLGQPAGRDHSSHRAAARSRAPGAPSRVTPAVAVAGPSATTGAEGFALVHRRPVASTHPNAPSAPIVSSTPSTPAGAAPSSTPPAVIGHVAESAPAHIAEAPASTTPTKPEGPAGGSSPPPQGGSEETKTSGGQTEREAEEARARKEHEEQEARERKEREADDNGGSDDGGERLGTDD